MHEWSAVCHAVARAKAGNGRRVACDFAVATALRSVQKTSQ
jgi:hypothetical protein